MNYKDRLLKSIPGGAHTYSRGYDQFPSNAPQILERGEGAYVWDPKGNKYLDYGMGLRSVTLGYAYQDVARAASDEIYKGNALTRASLTELEAAELMIDLIPGADMVKFAKNGSNVTTAAAKVARSYTGKRYICVPRQHPFFSFDDWFIGSTVMSKGVPDQHISNTLIFDYNDINSLKILFDKYPNQIAGVMLEPATTEVPCAVGCRNTLSYNSSCSKCPSSKDTFLHSVQAICRANNSLFILDEMITGFRWHLNGAQNYFGLDPDLSTFGKGMANGFSVAALVGKRDIMDVGSICEKGAERTFLLSSTHGAEMVGLRAFIETIKVYKEHNVCEHLWDYGEKLAIGIMDISKELGLEDSFSIVGPSISQNFLTKDLDGNISLPLRTLFSQEMIKNGVILSWIATSLSHKDKELEITFEAARKSLIKYSEALNNGVENYLIGDVVKPVFRKHN